MLIFEEKEKLKYQGKDLGAEQMCWPGTQSNPREDKFWLDHGIQE